MTILVTGGFGFIGSNFVLRHQAKFPDENVVVLDKFTYAANPKNLQDADRNRLAVYRGDINNDELIANILSAHNPRAIINFAAETHVDRSINNASSFVQTNINGVANLLDLSRQYNSYRKEQKLPFRFIQIGTDEVYGSLFLGSALENMTPYAPRSPYSAAKAGADHLCMAYFHTYGLPVIVTNCCNNYGQRQYPEKFIPVAIRALLEGRKIPVYAAGQNIREWIYVDDHCDALEAVLERGEVGQQYNIGSPHNCTNSEMAHNLAKYMGRESHPTAYIQYVADRPGHDFRYSLDSSKIETLLGWKSTTTLEDGLKKTIEWYKNEYTPKTR